MNTRLGTVKRVAGGKGAQSMFIFPVRRCFCFSTSIQNLIKPTPMNDPGVGLALPSSPDMHYYTGHVSALGGTRTKSGGTGGYASLSSDVMMNGAILIAGLSRHGWHRADALFALGIGIYIFVVARVAYGV